VRIGGEIWQARCEAGADTGETVRVVGLSGLTLLVERV
jgi:membrane protein implicated in regulation of membrane protease activity